MTVCHLPVQHKQAHRYSDLRAHLASPSSGHAAISLFLTHLSLLKPYHTASSLLRSTQIHADPSRSLKQAFLWYLYPLLCYLSCFFPTRDFILRIQGSTMNFTQRCAIFYSLKLHCWTVRVCQYGETGEGPWSFIFRNRKNKQNIAIDQGCCYFTYALSSAC